MGAIDRAWLGPLAAAQVARSWTEPGRDAELLIAAQRGEREALFALLRAHRRELWRICLALTLDPERAERLHLETLVRAAKHVRAAPADAPVLHWLARLAAHLAVAWSRHEPAPGAAGRAWAASAGADPRFAASLARCPEPDRLLLALAVVERLSYADVARVTRRETQDVLRQLTRLRARLAGETSA